MSSRIRDPIDILSGFGVVLPVEAAALHLIGTPLGQSDWLLAVALALAVLGVVGLGSKGARPLIVTFLSG